MTHDVFISHSSKDKAVADAVCSTLETVERIRCWIAPRDVAPGQKWEEAILDAIAASSVMVMVLSASSNESDDVMNEVQFAASEGVVIVPFRIEDVSLSKSLRYHLGRRHWLDALDPPLEKHLQQLSRTVAATVGGAVPDRHEEPPQATQPERSVSVDRGGPANTHETSAGSASAAVPRDALQFRYDVFLSFANEDREWVLRSLYEPLSRCRSEDGRALRVCLDWKDSEIDQGLKSMKGLGEALAASRRIVVAVSGSYLDNSMSRWRLMRMADLEWASERVVPILLDPIPEGDVEAGGAVLPLGPLWLEIRGVADWMAQALDPHQEEFFRALCLSLGISRS